MRKAGKILFYSTVPWSLWQKLLIFFEIYDKKNAALKKTYQFQRKEGKFMELGILSLLPIVVLFTLIFTTKRLLMSLTAATLTGAILLGGLDFASTWLIMFQESFMEGTLGWILLLLGLFGIFIALLDASNAVTEFAQWLSKFANTKRKTLIITFFLGWIIFVDDYLNNMAISTAMKKVADGHKIPRTLLGHVINTTAAPVCIIVPISTWAVFYSGLFEEYGVVIDGSGMSAYIAAIPYLFYAWALLVVTFLLILGVIPQIGLTKKHSQIAGETGVVCQKEVSMDAVEITAAACEAGKDGKPWNFLVPLAVLIAVTFLTEVDVMIGCMAGIAVSGIMMLAQKKMKLVKIFETAYSGVMNMMQISVIITMSFMLVGINTSTGLSDFVIAALSPLLHGALLPAIVFGVCALYSYFTGGFWDMSMVFMPIVVPLALAVGVDPLLPCAALVCASAAGSTTCVVGDAVMIVSRAVDVKPYYQMRATLPYAIISYVLAIIAYIIAGFVFI